MIKNIFLQNEKISILDIFKNHISFYPSPVIISYLWSFGSLAGLCLSIQIISGFFLVMHYYDDALTAFDSVEHIMRDVNYGWLLRYSHANGASYFISILFLHISRSLYYAGFTEENKSVWYSGVVIFLLTMATAFLGYVLPWGQMSFWGATVITNFFSAIPVIGTTIVLWIWGGFSVGGPTLGKFFAIHFILPIIIVALVLLHFYFLHKLGSSNPSYYETRKLNILQLPIYPYFLLKDLIGVLVLLTFFIISVAFYPNYLGHPDNYIEANPLVTPEHIVPEWYFLPFYAILRSIPDKLGGIIAMVLSLLILLICMLTTPAPINRTILNYILKKKWNEQLNIFSSIYDPSIYFLEGALLKITFFFFFSNFILLLWIGMQVVEEPYITVGKILTFIYFIFFTLGLKFK